MLRAEEFRRPREHGRLSRGDEQVADLLGVENPMHPKQRLGVIASVLLLHAPLIVEERRTLHEKNTEKALSPASPIAHACGGCRPCGDLADRTAPRECVRPRQRPTSAGQLGLGQQV
jgi:hypothetical protein